MTTHTIDVSDGKAENGIAEFCIEHFITAATLIGDPPPMGMTITCHHAVVDQLQLDNIVDLEPDGGLTLLGRRVIGSTDETQVDGVVQTILRSGDDVVILRHRLRQR